MANSSPTYSIGLCLPSRGLLHSRTMQDLIAMTLNYPVNWYFSHGNNIPECHEIVVEEALKDKNDYILLVEDDNAYNHDTLKDLLDANADIAVADYPVRATQHSAILYKGKVVHAGLGC